MCLLPSRRGFTLVELLITISIIGILASMMLFAMFQSQQTANEHKSRALIMKLNSIIMRRYDEYRTRRVPFMFPAVMAGNTIPDQKLAVQAIARARVDCLRDIMRMEMPDRWSDVIDAPVAPMAHTLPASLLPPFGGTIARPAVSQAYYDKWLAANTANSNFPTTDNQGAECLYMIVMGSLAQEGDSRDFFKAGDVGDVDEDGFPEFLDAWNQPIQFIRWAPGFQSELQSPIRLRVAISQDDPHTATVAVLGNDGPRLSQTPGSYVGGTIALVDPDSKIIDTRTMAKVSAYRYDATVNPPVVLFTCTTPSASGQAPFANFNSTDCEVLVMQPDPFDSRGVYPKYPPGSTWPPGQPDISVPTYAIYPLIFSKGPDRAGGLMDGGGLRYADIANVALNPFYIPAAGSEPFGLFLGSAIQDPPAPREPGWYFGCHNDNITNHQLTTR